GLHDGDWFNWGDADFPVHIFYNAIPEIGILFVFAALFIPFLYVFIAGITIIAKRKVMSSSVGWSILGIWMISVLGAFATVPNVVRDFRDEGYYDVTEILDIQADTVTLSLKEYEYQTRRDRRFRNSRDIDFNSEFTDLDVRASKDNSWSLEKRATARGRNPEDADRNAEEIIYNYNVNGNEIVFDRELTLDENAKFRFQDLNMTLYIPVNQPFKVSRDMNRLLKYFSYRYTWWEVYRNTWSFDTDGNLKCLTCDEEEVESSLRGSNETKTFNLSNFNDISIASNIQVEISYDEDFQVQLEGDASKFADLRLTVVGDRLSVTQNSDEFNWGGTTLKISVPKVNNLNISESAEVSLRANQYRSIAITTSANSRLKLDGKIETLSLIVSDDSRIDSEAEIFHADMSISDSGRFFGYDGEVQECILSINGEGRARLSIEDYLEVDARGFSTVRYKGSPKVDIKEKSGSAVVSQY
ncbi:MAG TPA: DUF2807 domain-containing protein, partial [Roseivirga sp.]